MTLKCVFGLGAMTRQLLPFGIANGKPSRETVQLFRYVTWAIEPITWGQAAAHLELGGNGACVVRVRRGPKGGWTGAQFITGAMPLKKFTQAVTLYYGWVNGRKLPDPRDYERIPEAQWRATLILHAWT